MVWQATSAAEAVALLEEELYEAGGNHRFRAVGPSRAKESVAGKPKPAVRAVATKNKKMLSFDDDEAKDEW